MSKNNAKNDKMDQDQFPQPAKKQTFSEMIYDPRDGTILGRTTKSWGQLLLFYTIFYIILAILFAICMQGMLSTVNEHEPKWKLDESLIGTNPGLGFRPLSEETERGSVIRFSTKKPEESKYWVDLLNDFLKDYQNTEGRNMTHCDYNQVKDPQHSCVVELDKFGPCSPANEFGYKEGKPCIFLKLNKIYGWVPEVYDSPNPSMPSELQNLINNTVADQRNNVWITCSGHHGKDKEQFHNITYYPTQGFPAYFYPYKNMNSYLSPLVAVQFTNPPVGAMLDVECRAWAKNVIYSGSLNDRKGSVTFQMLIE